MKGWKIIILANGNQRKEQAAIHISDKIGFKIMKVGIPIVAQC